MHSQTLNIPPPSELLWRYDRIDLCLRLLCQNEKFEDLIKELSPSSIPRWYLILTRCCSDSKLEDFKIEEGTVEVEEFLWLFQNQYFLPKFGEWNFNPLTGENHPVVNLMFSKYWEGLFHPPGVIFQNFQKEPQSVDLALVLQPFSEGGIKVNLKGWDQDEKTGKNHPTVQKI